jgi:hypothetical protein
MLVAVARAISRTACGKVHRPRTRQLVQLAVVPGCRQCRGGDIRDVVGVYERLADVAHGE